MIRIREMYGYEAKGEKRVVKEKRQEKKNVCVEVIHTRLS